ncbi:MAG: hypothetical protein JNJ55_06185, partial [Betaproteobacteria bacterium]|nr:hypothetical protein [Betaproteobacteria bacterium]
MKRTARARGFWFAFFFACAVPAAQAQSQVPRTLSYQGTLSTSAAVPVNGAQTIVFSLYNAASGGTTLWTETQSVNVANGLFNVTLGGSTPIELPFNVPYFLGVKVGADAEMTPRNPLASSAYALRARTADLAGPGDHNTFAGVAAGTSSPSIGSANTALGSNALANPSFNSANNTAIGSYTLRSGVSGGDNTAVGANAMHNSVAASSTTALGADALYSNVSGSNNVAIGRTS